MIDAKYLRLFLFNAALIAVNSQTFPPPLTDECDPCRLVGNGQELIDSCAGTNPLVSEIVARDSSCGRFWDAFCLLEYNDCYGMACGVDRQGLIDDIANRGGPDGRPIDREQLLAMCPRTPGPTPPPTPPPTPNPSPRPTPPPTLPPTPGATLSPTPRPTPPPTLPPTPAGKGKGAYCVPGYSGKKGGKKGGYYGGKKGGKKGGYYGGKKGGKKGGYTSFRAGYGKGGYGKGGYGKGGYAGKGGRALPGYVVVPTKTYYGKKGGYYGKKGGYSGGKKGGKKGGYYGGKKGGYQKTYYKDCYYGKKGGYTKYYSGKKSGYYSGKEGGYTKYYSGKKSGYYSGKEGGYTKYYSGKKGGYTKYYSGKKGGYYTGKKGNYYSYDYEYDGANTVVYKGGYQVNTEVVTSFIYSEEEVYTDGGIYMGPRGYWSEDFTYIGPSQYYWNGRYMGPRVEVEGTMTGYVVQGNEVFFDGIYVGTTDLYTGNDFVYNGPTEYWDNGRYVGPRGTIVVTVDDDESSSSDE